MFGDCNTKNKITTAIIYICFVRLLKICVVSLAYLLNVTDSFYAQAKLQVLSMPFGRLKKYEFHPGDRISYKLKGERKFLTGNVLALGDSCILFEADSVGLNQLKAIRFKSNNYHAKLFQKIFLIGGVGFPSISLANNSINNVDPLLNKTAAIVTASFLAASFLVHQSCIKRMRLTKNKIIKIVDIDYEHLNQR